MSVHAADGGDVGRAETVGSKVEPSLQREPAGPGNLAPAKNQVSQSKKSPDKSSLMNRGTHRTVFSPKPITSQPPSTPASSKSIELPAEPAPPPAKKRRNAEEDGFY